MELPNPQVYGIRTSIVDLELEKTKCIFTHTYNSYCVSRNSTLYNILHTHSISQLNKFTDPISQLLWINWWAGPGIVNCWKARTGNCALHGSQITNNTFRYFQPWYGSFFGYLRWDRWQGRQMRRWRLFLQENAGSLVHNAVCWVITGWFRWDINEWSGKKNTGRKWSEYVGHKHRRRFFPI